MLAFHGLKLEIRNSGEKIYHGVPGETLNFNF